MGKYLRLFDNHSGYTTFTQTEEFVKPNVSHCIEENHVHYNPYDYSDRYLTFIALEDGSEFSFNPISSNTISYSVDDGETWTTLTNGVSTPSIDSGEKIMWKGEMTSYMDLQQGLIGLGAFTSTKTFDVEGNVMSLFYGDDFRDEDSLYGKDAGFALLFTQTKVVNAKNLYLPTTLAGMCYFGMFGACTNLVTAPKLRATTMTSYYIEGMYVGCYTNMFASSNLTIAPELPAITLAEGCYGSMFANSNLTTAPELPATTLAERCYANMFENCTGLTAAPELPATTLADECYFYMFGGCNNLTTTPELPATTLESGCYREMFHCCIKLTTAPELPATTLANRCYEGMFRGCEGLLEAPSLPATTLAEDCYRGMFGGGVSYHIYDGREVHCTSLTTAPELPATTLANRCYNNMFQGCTSLNYIKAMFTTTPSSDYTYNWVEGVASSGTFVKNSAAQWNVSGVHGIPSGWAVQTASE